MRITATAAATLAAAALLAPTASARLPIEEQTAAPAYRAAPAPAQLEGQPPRTTQMARIEPPAPTVTASVTPDDGFDWGAAAIGAGGVGAVLLLTAAGTSAAGHRRDHRVAR